MWLNRLRKERFELENKIRELESKLKELEKGDQEELHKEYLKEFELYRDSGRDYSRQLADLKSKFIIIRRES
jgi:predicted  nucleic acid-binding Zn-ribbon protein